MALTINNLSFEDLPIGRAAGNLVKRRRRFILTGTVSAATDFVAISTYEPNVATIDNVQVYTVSGGNVALGANPSYAVGSVAVGTVNPFTMVGIITLN